MISLDAAAKGMPGGAREQTLDRGTRPGQRHLLAASQTWARLKEVACGRCHSAQHRLDQGRTDMLNPS